MLIAFAAMLTATSAVAQNQITLTTSKAVGETIELEIKANGAFSVEGATLVEGKEYTIADANGKIILKGDITFLDCGSSMLTSLDVTKAPSLSELDCEENQLTSLDVTKNLLLSELHCEENRISSLDVTKNVNLTDLNCSANQITLLNVVNNTELLELHCSSNKLTSLDVTKNTKLEELWCFDNQLSQLDLSKNKQLTELACSLNKIQGQSMDNLIASLPVSTETDGEKSFLGVIDNTTGKEGNICTKKQVAAAKSKGWIPQEWKGDAGWIDYEGSSDVSIKEVLPEGEASVVAIYSVDGHRLSELQPGVNIVRLNNGKTRKIFFAK
ncbi:hypothetical protein PORCRE_1335 [Porphyromonas crevioricanis JCM 15906]|nr:hypothetical protein PORCRE_1335 [Porphyromonas crevioricanis JCM 15906]GAD06516.1 hypothetical protein PORCAN_112 [Porphyromonas crevioricanis JCM 13913]